MHIRNFLLYVAGPYSADTDEGISQNIENAGVIAQQLWDEGFTVICPHTNTAQFTHDKTSYADYIEGDLVMLARCDGIVLIDGWENSKGAIGEKERAELLNIPVFDLTKVSISAIKGYFENKLKDK